MAYPPAISSPASTAKSYALVGLIFYVLAVVFGLFITLGSLFFLVLFPLVWFLVSLGLTAWAAVTYQNIERGRYADARTATLILGIFGIVFGFLIGGIFFLLAYGKLGEIFQPHYPYGSTYPLAYPSTYPQSYSPNYPPANPPANPPGYPPSYQQPPVPQPAPSFGPTDHHVCVNCGRPISAGMKFCPSCGKEIPP